MGNHKPKISIVLLNYNGSKYAPLWESIFRQTFRDFEVIFVDNGSSDNSVEKFLQIASKYPNINVKVVKLKRNVGYSKGNNIGLLFARGDYVVLLSNDIEVERTWLEEMVRFLNTNPNVAAVQSLLYSFYDRKRIDYMSNFIGVLGYCYLLIQRYPEIIKNPLKDFYETFYSEGAVMFIKRDLIFKLGGLFNDFYFMLYEDIDFCWRARLRGYRVGVMTKSRAYHVRGGTVKGAIMKDSPLFVYTNVRNRLVTLFKNYEAINVIKYIPLSLVLEFIKCIWLMLRNKRLSGIMGLKGITSFIRNLKVISRYRCIAQSIRKIKDEKILKLMYPLRTEIINLIYVRKSLEKPSS